MKDFRYEYWIRLINSISSYIKEKEEIDFSYFKYNGINFREVFRRYVYFQIQYKDKIRDAILNNLKNSSNDTIIKLDNKTLRAIYSKMYPAAKLTFVQNNNVIRTSNKIKSFKIYNQKYKYVFIIIDNRFIDYLFPLYKKLDNCCFILLPHLEISVAKCKEMDINFIQLDEVNYSDSANNMDLNIFINAHFCINNLIEQIKPKTIITIDGNSHWYELFNISAKMNNIKCLCIQNSWSPVIHSGYQNMSYSAFLTWGEYFSIEFRKFNKKQKFISVGHHLLTNITNNGKPSTNNIAILMPGDIEDLCLYDKEKMIQFEDCIISIIHKFDNVIIREHPFQKNNQKFLKRISNIKKIDFMNQNTHTLSEVLNYSDIVISVYSSILIEALAFNCIPIIFNNTSLPNYKPNLDKFNMAIEVKNKEECIKTIIQLLKKDIFFSTIKKSQKEKINNIFKSLGSDSENNIIMEIKNDNK